MDKKVIYIGLGVLALGAAYYFWNKNQQNGESSDSFENAEGKKVKKSFCQEHPDNYNCRVKKSGGVLLAK